MGCIIVGFGFVEGFYFDYKEEVKKDSVIEAKSKDSKNIDVHIDYDVGAKAGK
mgnify:CR=1 FL=1